MNVHEPVTRLCPARVCGSATGTGFGSLLRQSANSGSRRVASPHRARVRLGGVARHGDAGRRGSSPRPSCARRFPGSTLRTSSSPTVPGATSRRCRTRGLRSSRSFGPTRATCCFPRPRHLLQLQATDTLLGQILARLKRAGAYDDSLVVVTADHGVAFTKGEPSRGDPSELPGGHVAPALHQVSRTAHRADRRSSRADDRHPPDDRRRHRHEDSLARRRQRRSSVRSVPKCPAGCIRRRFPAGTGPPSLRRLGRVTSPSTGVSASPVCCGGEPLPPAASPTFACSDSGGTARSSAAPPDHSSPAESAPPSPIFATSRGSITSIPRPRASRGFTVRDPCVISITPNGSPWLSTGPSWP